MLRRYVAMTPDDGAERDRVRHCADALAAARPAMGAVGNVVRHWAGSMVWAGPAFRMRALRHCDRIASLMALAWVETVAAAHSRLGDLPRGAVVLTHSASGTVRAALEDLPLAVVVTESEPGGEGRALAAALDARVVPDAEAAGAVRGASAVVVGADAVGRAAFANKVGTLALARAADEAGVPFFVAAESYKCVTADRPPTPEAGFENTPNELVTAFCCDRRFSPIAAA